jgi:ketose-bisphosphate aldolase
MQEILVPLTEMLGRAQKGHYSVPAFNTYDYGTAAAIVEAAAKLRSPVIIAYGEGSRKTIPLEIFASMVRKIAERKNAQIALHLDHAQDIHTIRLAIRNGFTSVMYDGSKLPYATNRRRTREVVSLAHASNVSVEAELGHVTQAEGSDDTQYHFTDPEQSREFALETGIDALAVAIGNVHGLRSFSGAVKLDFDLLSSIRQKCPVPLVLHGGSGVQHSELLKSIEFGICKLNVNTELSMATTEAVRNFLEGRPGNIRYDSLLSQAFAAAVAIASSYILMLNSKGKARRHQSKSKISR